MMLSKLFSHSYAGNVPKYFIYGALYNFMLFFPVWVIFLQETRGLTLPQVTFVDVAFWLTTALMVYGYREDRSISITIWKD